MVADTDRDKYCVRRIIDFYQRQRTDYADYFLAAWRFRHREALGRPEATLADFAAEAGLSPKYLATIWSTLTEPAGGGRPDRRAAGAVAGAAAAPTGTEPDAARAGCERMRDFVVELRQQLTPEVKNLTARGIHDGSQPLRALEESPVRGEPEALRRRRAGRLEPRRA